jgi:hypothetical protein
LKKDNKSLLDDTDDRLTQKCEEVRTLYDKISELKNNLKFYKSGYIDEIAEYKKKLRDLEAALAMACKNHDDRTLVTVNGYEQKLKSLKEKLENDKESSVLGLRATYQETIANFEKSIVEKDGILKISRDQCFGLEDEVSKYRAGCSGLEISLQQKCDQKVLTDQRVLQ